METNVSLSKRELDIMKIMWKAGKPCTASEVARNSNISISTVHNAVNKLLKKEMIVVDEIIFSGKVLSRCYKPTISASEYEIGKVMTSLKGIVSAEFTTANLVEAFLGQMNNKKRVMSELDGLEELVKEMKENLGKKK